MIEDVAYAGLLILIIYAADYAAFAKMTNVVEIARLTRGDDADEQTYSPLTPLRVWLALGAAIVFFVGESTHPPLRQMLYVAAGIMAFVIVAVTCGSAASRRIDGS
jgi:hypothetical protein